MDTLRLSSLKNYHSFVPCNYHPHQELERRCLQIAPRAPSQRPHGPSCQGTDHDSAFLRHRLLGLFLSFTHMELNRMYGSVLGSVTQRYVSYVKIHSVSSVTSKWKWKPQQDSTVPGAGSLTHFQGRALGKHFGKPSGSHYWRAVYWLSGHTVLWSACFKI